MMESLAAIFSRSVTGACGQCSHRRPCPVSFTASVGRTVVLAVLITLLALANQSAGASSYIWASESRQTSDITCWTCNNKGSNEDCNNWAPDLKCPFNHTVCRTVHRLSSSGLVSVQVDKRCVHPSQCTPKHVGCTATQVADQLECVSCCDYDYCNQDVPVNATSALQLSTFTPTHPRSAAHPPASPASSVIIIMAGTTLVLTRLASSGHGHWLRGLLDAS